MDKSSCFWGFLSAALLAFGVAFCALYFTKDSSNDITTDPRSVELAGRILSQMNTSADPCNNFWEYACGGFLSKNILPGDKSRLSEFDVADEEIYVVLKNQLESQSAVSNPKLLKNGKVRPAIQKSIDFYAACMDEEALSTDSFIAHLENDLKGWPVVR